MLNITLLLTFTLLNIKRPLPSLFFFEKKRASHLELLCQQPLTIYYGHYSQMGYPYATHLLFHAPNFDKKIETK